MVRDKIKEYIVTKWKEMTWRERFFAGFYTLAGVCGGILLILALFGQLQTTEARNCADQFNNTNQSFYSKGECYNRTTMETAAKHYLYQSKFRGDVSSDDIARQLDIYSFDVSGLLDPVVKENCHFVKTKDGWLETEEWAYIPECPNNQTDELW